MKGARVGCNLQEIDTWCYIDFLNKKFSNLEPIDGTISYNVTESKNKRERNKTELDLHIGNNFS